MFRSWTYLIWLALFIGLPIIIMAFRWRTTLIRQWRTLLLIVLGALAGGWAWDALSVRVGVWHYRPENVLGHWFLGLPLEEWLWIAGVALMFGMLTVILMKPAEA